MVSQEKTLKNQESKAENRITTRSMKYSTTKTTMFFAEKINKNRQIRKTNTQNIHRKSKITRWDYHWRQNHLINKVLPLLLRVLLFLLCITYAKASIGISNQMSTQMSTIMRARKQNPQQNPQQSHLYSRPLTAINGIWSNDENEFQPMIPKDVSREYISRNIFTKTGQHHVFNPIESDLRMSVAAGRKDYNAAQHHILDLKETFNHNSTSSITKQPLKQNTATNMTTTTTTSADETKITEAPEIEETAVERPLNKRDIQNELNNLEHLLAEYVENFFSKVQDEPMPSLLTELESNRNDQIANSDLNNIKHLVKRALEDTKVSVDLPRALQTGRLIFSTGLKKMMWPIYMGLQMLKSVLFALFLPAIIGSVSRLIGKGITSGSAGSVPLLVRPMESPQDLDFRDNNFDFEDDNKYLMINADDGKDGFSPAASQTQVHYTSYSPNVINQMALERQHQQLMHDTYLNALQSIGAASFKNSQSISGASSAALGGATAGVAAGMVKKPAAPANMNTFQTFQKVPASSLLLSNYDPFYSPLLSRLDSVFARLKLNADNEVCREKLICLMYANPTKYAPYSNLVSAQLSRELNELRKPTSDNPEILRFFKYMRAAKDGQDGVDCELTFDRCTEFKDFDNPAMLSTYNDINKLVQARKLT